ncbi:hypothetical protein [Paraburkholderia caledonica]|uniref:Uncharacterized protein n=1 Tax=Paraburkholderia caledonica TaxID=134536 RepID=A0AB73INP9_9BURK|nr:hypothetical protein [Paraburkholderia caledonica]
MALALISVQASGAPLFPKAMTALHIEDGGVYSTDWRVYPIRVERADIADHKPESMALALFEDGKEGNFEGLMHIDCERPVASFIATGINGDQKFDNVPLRDMMKTDALPRQLISNIFAVFCKGSSLSQADLNMSRD